MWKIKQIFDGDFGFEELALGERPKVSVTLENEFFYDVSARNLFRRRVGGGSSFK